jgi:ribosomal RNA assembly protein
MIPENRVGALIGPHGRDKKTIEKTFNITLEINSITGKVEIKLNPEQKDASVLFSVQNIVKAIGRGFTPQKAMNLIHDDYHLIIIDLEEYVGSSKNTQNRVKGRIIGRGGKARALIEQITGCNLSIYGSTISLIGPFYSLPFAREAIMMLIKGAFHKTVWNYLYAFRRQLRKEKGQIWYNSSVGVG